MNRIARSITTLCCLFFFMSSTFAQMVDMDTVIYPLATKGQSFENYLVSLAWENNPEYRIHAANKLIATKEVQLAKRAWADDWNITLNLNENNLRGSDIDTARARAITILDDSSLGGVANELRGLEQLLTANNFCLLYTSPSPRDS